MNAKVAVLLLILSGFLSVPMCAQDSIVRLATELVLSDDGALIPSEHPFFDEGKNTVYFQYDVNRLPATVLSKGHVLVEIKKKSIEQSKLKPIMSQSFPIDAIHSTGLDSLDIQNQLYSGNFDILFHFCDSSGKNSLTRSIPIQAFKPGLNPKKQEFLIPDLNQQKVDTTPSSFVNKYNTKQLKANIASLMPIAQGGEIQFVRNVEENQDVKLLQLFFYNFWSNRDAGNPEKAWRAYADKLNFVAKTYGTAQQKGYETDRGKLFILYGHPDKIEHCLQEKNARPYEIWFYYSARGKNNVKFLFVQPGMMSNQFILLHSTESDILINTHWRENLLLSDPSNDQQNRLKHRVFEYFN